MAIATPGWRETQANARTVRSSSFGPPRRCPAASATSVISAMAVKVPSRTSGSRWGHAPMRTGMAQATSRIEPSFCITGAQALAPGERRAIANPANSGSSTEPKTTCATASGLTCTASLSPLAKSWTPSTASGVTITASNVLAKKRPLAPDIRPGTTSGSIAWAKSALTGGHGQRHERDDHGRVQRESLADDDGGDGHEHVDGEQRACQPAGLPEDVTQVLPLHGHADREHREKNAGGEPGADQRLEVHRLAPSRRPAGLAIGSPVGLFAACRGAPAFTGSITRKTRS